MNPLFYSLCDWSVKSIVLLTLGFAIARVMRRSSAARRHLLWLAVLALVLVLPATHLINPRWAYTWEKATARATLPPITNTVELLQIPTKEAALPAVISERSVTQLNPWKLPSWSTLLIGVWLTGVAAVFAHRLLGSVLLARLRRASSLVDDERILKLIRSVAGETGIARDVEVRQSAESGVPVTWGLRNHVLLLPVSALKWNDSRLLAAFRHEFAHIVRRDYLSRLLATFACALYWPNPLVWLAARSLRTAQEQACDDRVLRAGTSAEDYATLLFEAAKNMVRLPLSTRQAMAMAQPSTLETRITAIVDDRDRRLVGRHAPLLAGLAVMAALLVCATAQISNTDKAPVAETAAKTTGEMSTKRWEAEPEVFRSVGGVGGKTSKEFFEASDVKFPHGATVAYNPGLKVLTVRNTAENLKLVDEIMEFNDGKAAAAKLRLKEAVRERQANVEKLQNQLVQINQLKPEELMEAMRILNIEDSTVVQILPALVAARAEVAKEIAAGAKESGPRVKSLHAQMKVYREILDDQLKSIIRSLYTKIEVEKNTLKSLEGKAAAAEIK